MDMVRRLRRKPGFYCSDYCGAVWSRAAGKFISYHFHLKKCVLDLWSVK